MDDHPQGTAKNATMPLDGVVSEPPPGGRQAAARTGLRARLAGRWSRGSVVTAAAVAVVALTGVGVATATALRGAAPPPQAHRRPAIGADRIEPLQDAGTGKRSTKAGQADRAADSPRAARRGSPSPSHVGLCRAVRSMKDGKPGKALGSPPFANLIESAGGKDELETYCTGVLAAARAGGPPPSKPDNRDKSHQPRGRGEYGNSHQPDKGRGND